MDNNHKYVVLALNLWDRIEAMTPSPLPVSPIGLSCGFLLVYDRLADLQKDYPASQHITIMPMPLQPPKGGEHGKTKEATRPTRHRRAGRSPGKNPAG